MQPDFYNHAGVRIINADCRDALRVMEPESVDCCITSPPYWALRDYGVSGQIGLEDSLEQFVAEMVVVFEEVRRVLRPTGTLWLNLGDTHANDGRWGGSSGGKMNMRANGAPAIRNKRVSGLKPKDLCGVPWRVAFALQAAGWWLRSDIVWHKPTAMPESVQDRPTRDHEFIFLLAKSARYFYDADAIKVPTSGTSHERKPRVSNNKASSADEQKVRGNLRYADAIRGTVERRNIRTVWKVSAEKFEGAHFATFPTALVKPMVLAGCPAGGVVLDPFAGAGTTMLVAKELGRRAIGVELNPEYCAMAVERLKQDSLPLTEKPSQPLSGGAST